MKRFIVLCLLLLSTTAFADAIDNCAQGTWCQLTGKNISTVYPGTSGITGPSSVVIAWCGGAFDTTGNRLIIHGGGHTDYGGNEVYAFDLDTLVWARIWGPSSGIPDYAPESCSETYGDGAPASVHSYGGLTYIPSTNEMLRVAGSLYCQNGNASTYAWTMNLGTPAWTRRSDFSDTMQGVACATYATGNKAYCQTYRNLYEYNPSTGNWTSRGETFGPGFSDDDNRAAVDEDNGLFILTGPNQSFTGLLSVNLSTFVGTERSTTNGSAVEDGQYGSLTWDSTNHKIVGYPGSGTNIYTLNTSTWVWTTVAASGGPPSAAITSGGSHGRFAYCSSRDVFVWLTGESEAAGGGSNSVYDVWVLKNPLSEEAPATIPTVRGGTLRGGSIK